MPPVLNLVQTKHNQDAIKQAETLLDMCRKGEIVSFMVVMEDARGTYTCGGSTTWHRKEWLGALLELIFYRQGQP